MIPKTKEQKKVFKLYKKLRKQPYVKVLKWHMDNEVDNYAFISSIGRCSCLKCGHIWKEHMCPQKWQNEIVFNNQKCPKCKRTLKIEVSNKRTVNGYWYFSTIEVIEDYQVFRVYQRFISFKSKNKPTTWNRQVSCLFTSPEGKQTYVGMYQINSQSEQWCGIMEIRNKFSYLNYKAIVYPKYEVTEKLNRNGFIYEFYDNIPIVLFRKLLTENICETLWKIGQHELVKKYNDYSKEKYKLYWSSIKICIRNNYFIENAQEWFDHLGLLEHYGKDLLNTKYVCPENFGKEHQKYIERKRKDDDKKDYLELQTQIKKDEVQYKKHIVKYKKLCIESNSLVIKPILTVMQLQRESNILKHCAYSSKYHKRVNSLMLSAKFNNVILETIQFDLNTYKVIQSRGIKNGNSKYHKDIVQLVNDHSKEIIKMKKSLKKKSLKRKTQKVA